MAGAGKLWTTPQERDILDPCANVLDVIKTCDRLEKVRGPDLH